MYRDDADALLARVDALQRELDATAHDKDRIRELTDELERTRAELAALRSRTGADQALARVDEPPREPRRRGWLRRWYLAIPLGGVTAAAIVLLPAAIGGAAASCSGYDQFLVSTLEQCPRAHELLGDDIAQAHVGMACGSTSTQGGTGTASWRMPFAGTHARGTVKFDSSSFTVACGR